MTAYSPMGRSAAGLSTQLGDDWRDRAACRAFNPEIWFPVGTSGPSLRQAEQAKAVCRQCPVKTDCLAWALETGAQDGIWGGLDEIELMRLRAKPITADVERTQLVAATAKTPPTRPKTSRTGMARPCDHHETIVELLTQTPRPTYARVAEVIGARPIAVQKYWLRFLDRVERTHGPEARALLAPAGRANRSVVERWLPFRDSGLPGREIAARIGVTEAALNAALHRARETGDERVPAVTSRYQRQGRAA